MTWPAYAVCAWAALFGGWHLYWALGGDTFLLTATGGELDRLAAQRDPGFVLWGLWGVVAVCALGALIALATVRPWGRAVPRWLLLGPLWLAFAVMLLRGVVYGVISALAVTGVVDKDDPWHPSNLALFSPYFLLGAGLVAAMALRATAAGRAGQLPARRPRAALRASTR